MGTKRLRSLFFAVSLAAAGEAFAGGTFYGSGTTGEVFTIDIATGAGTLVGTLPPLCFGGTAAGVTEIEFDNFSGRAFAACFGDSFSGFEVDISMYGIAGGPGPANLYTINLATGAATVVGSTGIQSRAP